METPYKIEHNEYKEGEMGKCTELANWAEELGVNAFQNQWSQQQREDEQMRGWKPTSSFLIQIFV